MRNVLLYFILYLIMIFVLEIHDNYDFGSQNFKKNLFRSLKLKKYMVLVPKQKIWKTKITFLGFLRFRVCKIVSA